MKLFNKRKKPRAIKTFMYDFNLTSPFDYVIEFDENKIMADIFKVIDSTGVDPYNTPICEFYVRSAFEDAINNLGVQREEHRKKCREIAKQDQIEKDILNEMARTLRACVERGEDDDEHANNRKEI